MSRTVQDSRFVPVSAVTSAALICRDLAAAAVALTVRRPRNRERVAEEYDRGYWADVLQSQRWTSSATLEEFLTPPDDGWRVCKVNNRFVRARHADYYRFRRQLLADVLGRFAAGEPELVELGTGYGVNLFGLSLTGKWARLTGLDVSDAGIGAGQMIARHFGLEESIAFARLDLTNGADSGLARLHQRVAFTHYCLEQLPYDIERVIRNLMAAGVKRVIHIEPAAELLKWYSPKDLVNYAHILRSDYQRTLLRTLRRIERNGEIRLLEVRRLYYAPSVRHDPALIVWEPTAVAGLAESVA